MTAVVRYRRRGQGFDVVDESHPTTQPPTLIGFVWPEVPVDSIGRTFAPVWRARACDGTDLGSADTRGEAGLALVTHVRGVRLLIDTPPDRAEFAPSRLSLATEGRRC